MQDFVIILLVSDIVFYALKTIWTAYTDWKKAAADPHYFENKVAELQEKIKAKQPKFNYWISFQFTEISEPLSESPQILSDQPTQKTFGFGESQMTIDQPLNTKENILRFKNILAQDMFNKTGKHNEIIIINVIKLK